ncbi:hypothetical protein FRB94_007294 [Tulasnella sp. JGI-2019a]|nr:hypothetical protein FRB94_007294 [Tulasnella sp. JGI-2019a]
MSRPVASGQPRISILGKDDLVKLKRIELQGLCKEKCLRANGTNAAMIEALVAHFDGISIGSRAPDSVAFVASVRTPSKKRPPPLSKTSVTRLIDSPGSSPSPSTDSDNTATTLPAVNSTRIVAQRHKQGVLPVSKLKENQGGPNDARSQIGYPRGLKPRLEGAKNAPLVPLQKKSRVSSASHGVVLGLSKSGNRASISSNSTIGLSNKTQATGSAQTAALEAIQKQIEDLISAFKIQNDELALRVDEQEQKIEAQQRVIDNLQASVEESNKLVMTIRQLVAEEMSLDVASCVQQTSDLLEANAGVDGRIRLMETEMFTEGGKLYQACKEIGDLDVAMMSERDRLSKLVEKVAVLTAKIETPVVPATSKRRPSVRNSVNEGMDFPVVDAESANPASMDDPFTPSTHGRRLSRASISAVLHATPRPTSRNSSSNDSSYDQTRTPTTGLRRDFKFPNTLAALPSQHAKRNTATGGGYGLVRSRVQSSLDVTARQSTPAFSRVRTQSTISTGGLGRQMASIMGSPNDDHEDSTINGFDVLSPAPHRRRRSGSAAFLKKDLLARSPGHSSSSSRPSDQAASSNDEDENPSLLNQPQPSFSALGTDDDYTAGTEED